MPEKIISNAKIMTRLQVASFASAEVLREILLDHMDSVGAKEMVVTAISESIQEKE